jgi:chromate transport protein ChrA
MGILASLVVLVACVKLLSATRDPKVVAGVFSVCKVAVVLLLGGGLIAALGTAVVAALVGFGFFWLLNRLEGTGLWWAALILGVLLLL